MAFEPARFPQFCPMTSDLPTKIGTSWSSEFVNEEEYEITTRGPLASLARRQQCSSKVFNEKYRVDGFCESHDDTEQTPLSCASSSPRIYSSMVSPCSTLVSVRSKLVPTALTGPEKGVIEYNPCFEDFDETVQNAGDCTASYSPMIPSYDSLSVNEPSFASSRSIAWVPEPTTPGTFCANVQGSAVKNNFLSTLRKSRSSFCEALVSQVEELDLDKPELSLARAQDDCLGSKAISRVESEKSFEPVQFPSNCLSGPRKALINETSTSPFVKKWIHKSKKESAAVYRNTALCSQLPRYLISELHDSADPYTAFDSTL